MIHHKFMPTSANCGQGVGLSRQARPDYTGCGLGLVDLVPTCYAGACPRATIVAVEPNKLQTMLPRVKAYMARRSRYLSGVFDGKRETITIVEGLCVVVL